MEGVKIKLLNVKKGTKIACANCGKPLNHGDRVYKCDGLKVKLYCYDCEHDTDKLLCGFRLENEHIHTVHEVNVVE